FDSVQTLAKDSTPEKFVGAGNQAYMGALSQLQSVITAVSSAPKPDPGLLGQGSQAASGAHSAVTQIAQSFRIDTDGRIDAQGNQFVSSGAVPVSARFVAFMQRAAEFTDTLFPNGSPTIRLTFALRQLPSKGIDQATVVIDGQTLASTARQQFTWTGGDASNVSLTATSGAVTLPPLTGQGPWSLFEFFQG